MNFAAARENMIELQVRPNGVTDHRIIDAMAGLAREDFVPEARRAVAYADEDIPLSSGLEPRCLIDAMSFAKLIQLAAITPEDKVLHVGAATGYGTLVLARMAKSVVALESDSALLGGIRKALAGQANVKIAEGALSEGVKADAPYNVIVVEGRVAEIPQSLISQLADGGRLVAVVGEADMAKACVLTVSGSTVARRKAFDASIAALPGFQKKKPAFVF
ncbi:protein-L-isoaspartate O-methyltransferase family protein [Aestuariivirga sp.]|uniref:protein-L-isoaspartate O-methyltransferase family protein n=1 Tax=Aestuariivirga sp. TaxID=2650926 RepID=UPI0039E23904